jgi:hypothetical protein
VPTAAVGKTRQEKLQPTTKRLNGIGMGYTMEWHTAGKISSARQKFKREKA